MQTVKTSPTGRVGDTSIPAAPQGCLSKQELFRLLYPHRKYRSDRIRCFFTQERLERCQLSEEEMRRIRIFPPEATAVIISDLKQFGFIRQ